MIKNYEGILSYKKMNGEHRRAYGIWMNQRQRCLDKKHKSYKHYGVNGLKVGYGAREFIGWWLFNISLKNWLKPTCGRIDHSKGYSFDNIEMQELRDNVKEENFRLGHTGTKKKKVVLLDDNGNPSIIFESCGSAQKYLGLHNVARVCTGEYKQEKGFRFKFYKEGST